MIRPLSARGCRPSASREILSPPRCREAIRPAGAYGRILHFTRHTSLRPPCSFDDLISCRNPLTTSTRRSRGTCSGHSITLLSQGDFCTGRADTVGGIGEFSPAEGSRTYRRKAVSSHLELNRIGIRVDTPPASSLAASRRLDSTERNYVSRAGRGPSFCSDRTPPLR